VTGFLATVAARIPPRHLTPAPGRQDHTTSPSASRIARHARAQRPPHPAPRFVTLRNAPPKERDGGGYKGDLGLRKIRIFFRKGLDSQIDSRTDLPVGLHLPTTSALTPRSGHLRRRLAGPKSAATVANGPNRVEHPARVGPTLGNSNEGSCRDTCLACFNCCRRSGVPDVLIGRRLHRNVR